MFDPSTFKFKKVPKEIWDSSEDNVKCNDPMAVNKIVMDKNSMMNSKSECNRLFNTKDMDGKINLHKNLPLFGDRDKDNVLNVFDSNPRKKKEVDRIKRILG